MTTKQPITDDRARQFYVHATAWDMEDVPRSSGSANARNVLAREWDAWLAAHDAKVKRDAAREALDGLASDELARVASLGKHSYPTQIAQGIAQAAWNYKHGNYGGAHPEDVTP